MASSPSTGTRIRGRLQSMSNQSAYADSRPCCSTSHQAGFSTGAEMPRWFGTMSTTSPRPAARAAVDTGGEAGRPAAVPVDPGGVGGVVAVVGADRRLQDGERYTAPTPSAPGSPTSSAASSRVKSRVICSR